MSNFYEDCVAKLDGILLMLREGCIPAAVASLKEFRVMLLSPYRIIPGDMDCDEKD